MLVHESIYDGVQSLEFVCKDKLTNRVDLSFDYLHQLRRNHPLTSQSLNVQCSGPEFLYEVSALHWSWTTRGTAWN